MIVSLISAKELRIPITSFEHEKTRMSAIGNEVYFEYEDGEETRIAGTLTNDMSVNVETLTCGDNDVELLNEVVLPALWRSIGFAKIRLKLEGIDSVATVREGIVIYE